MSSDYVARINRVIDFVQDNLGQELGVERLAAVAQLSPFHFHRIFRAMVGEPLGQFVRRLRLERAARRLCEAPDRSITEIALDTGFASPASFAKAFRERFGVSASEWRERRKNGQSMSKDGNAETVVDRYFDAGAWAPKWRVEMPNANISTHVEIRELPEQTIAYVRHTGPYQGNAELFGRLFGQLAQWAGPRGLLGPDAQFLSLYHDDPAITDDSKLRVVCGCVVPPDTEVSGEIGKTSVPGGTYAVGRFELNADEYGAAWDSMYGRWLPASGYQPDDRPALELYLNNPETHPEKKHVVEIAIPIAKS